MNNNYFTKKDKQKLINWLISLQNNDGGFSEVKDDLSTISCSYYTFRSLLKLEALRRVNKKKLIEFILSNKHPDGGFSNQAGQPPHPQYTSYSIFMLKELKELKCINVINLINWLKSFKKEDGGFNENNTPISDIKYTYYISRSLLLLNNNYRFEKDKLIKFILRHINPGGGFSNKPGEKPNSLITKHIVFLLDEILKN